LYIKSQFVFSPVFPNLHPQALHFKPDERTLVYKVLKAKKVNSSPHEPNAARARGTNFSDLSPLATFIILFLVSYAPRRTHRTVGKRASERRDPFSMEILLLNMHADAEREVGDGISCLMMMTTQVPSLLFATGGCLLCVCDLGAVEKALLGH
jgi:hypothetical protein